MRDYVIVVKPEDVTVRKPLAAAGKLAEVDYGMLGRWIDPISGKSRIVNGFTMVLCHSRRVFVRPVFRCDQETWTKCHVEAFEFFGGVPEQIRLDNLKTGVLKPDIYDPLLNRSYEELAQHYGVLLDPCRAGKPKDKPQVERVIQYARESFWTGRDFFSESQMTEKAKEWSRSVGDLRPHRHLPGTVAEIFAANEAGALLKLPPERFEVALWAKATVHPDCHVQVKRHFYSVPWRLMGKQLDVRVGERVVKIYNEGELVKTHIRQRGERRHTDEADLPEQKIAFLQRTPSWCRRRAADLGDAVKALVDVLLTEPMPLTRLRQAQAVVRLAETYEKERLDAACAMALQTDERYMTVKNILESGADQRREDDTARATDAGAYLHGQQTLLGGMS